MNKNPLDAPLRVLIKGGKLNISIGVNTLVFCSNFENGGPLKECSVEEKNAGEWAKDVAAAMEREDEVGNTLLTRMLERAMEQAFENGSGAVQYPKKEKCSH